MDATTPQTRVVERPDGTRIPYDVVGSGAPPRMVSAHNLTGRGLGGAPFFAPLVAAGWTLALPDLRGHGGAVVTDPEWLTPEAMAGDLLAVADHAGWSDAWLAGGSMGAAPALVAALDRPDRVTGLLLFAPAFGSTPNAAVEDFDRIARAFRQDGFDGLAATWRARFRLRGVAEQTLDQKVEQLAQHDPDSLLAVLETVPRWTIPGAVGRLAELEIPVIVIGWEGDDIHPFALAERIARAAPRGVLRRVGAGPAELMETAVAALRPVRWGVPVSEGRDDPGQGSG